MQMTMVISPLSETRRRRGTQDDPTIVTAAQTTRAQAEAAAEEISEVHVLKEEEIEVAEEASSRAPTPRSKTE